MRKLRQALNDDSRQPQAIKTIRGYGYRLLIWGGDRRTTGSRAAAAAGRTGTRPPRRGDGGAQLLAVALFALWWPTPLPPPTVTEIVPITMHRPHRHLPPPVTDGGRLFHLERSGNRWNLMQTSMIGGDRSQCPIRSATT